jgi:hypothetical protein
MRDFPIKSMMLGLFTEFVHFKLQLQWLIALGIVHTLKKIQGEVWSYFNYDSGTSSNSRSIQADQLTG